MRKIYIEPELQLITFYGEDIIVTSGLAITEATDNQVQSGFVEVEDFVRGAGFEA